MAIYATSNFEVLDPSGEFHRLSAREQNDVLMDATDAFNKSEGPGWEYMGWPRVVTKTKGKIISKVRL